jgi:hypothetical protein
MPQQLYRKLRLFAAAHKLHCFCKVVYNLTHNKPGRQKDKER